MNNHKKLVTQIVILIVLAVIVTLVGSASKAWADASTTKERIVFLREKRTLNENKLRTLKAKREQLLLLINAAKAKKDQLTVLKGELPPIELPPKTPTSTEATSTNAIPPIQVPPKIPTLPPVQITTNTTNTSVKTTTNTTTNTTSNTTTNNNTTTNKTTTSQTTTNTSTTNTPTTSTVAPSTSLFGSSLTGMTQTLIKPTLTTSVQSVTIKDKPAKKIVYTMSYSAPVAYFTAEIKCDAFIEAYNAAMSTLTPGKKEETYELEGEFPISEFTPKALEEIEKFAPYGIGNPEPLFGVKASVEEQRVLKGRHVKLKLGALEKNVKGIEGIWFNAAERLEISELLEKSAQHRKTCLFAGFPELNRYLGRVTPTLRIKAAISVQ